MKLKLRRILTIIIAAIYIIVALILLIYAAGWRFDSSTKSFNRVGAIYIDTKPSNAIVTINEKLLKKDTPLTIKNLPPDDYSVTIYKDGYYQWTSPVRVSSAETSRLNDITLIRKSVPVQLPFSDFTTVKLSFESDYAALVSTERISIYNFDNEDITFFNINILPDTISWSPYSNTILAQNTKNEFLLIDVGTETEPVLIEKLFNIKFSYVIWSDDEVDVLYASDGTNVYRLNIFQKTSTVMFSHRDIVLASTDYLIQKDGDDLVMIDKSGKPIKDIRFPNTSHVFITPLTNSIQLINDKENEIGYLFDRQNFRMEKLSFPIRETGSIIGNQLLIHNGYELISWNWKTDAKTLLLRTSEPISQPDWIVSGHYITFIQDGLMRIIESTTLNQNSYILEKNEIENLFVLKNTDNVLFVSEGLLYTVSF